MKICWGNLEDLTYVKKLDLWRKSYSNGHRAYFLYKDSCDCCGEPYLSRRNSRTSKEHNWCSNGCRFSSEFYKEHMLKNRKINFKKEDHPQWKGGYGHNTVTLYDTYALRLSFIENVKRSIGAHNILEVICTYCGKWFKPNRDSVARRVNFINDNINDNRTHGEHRFYCSAGCKTACPIFNKRKYPSGFKINSSREVQPELRKMVLERDTWTCQKCEETEVELHCHHITGVVQNPIESADVDNCITLCKECHKEVHKQYKCKYNELKCLEV